MTQPALGVDRDSETLGALLDESDPAVTRSITSLVTRAHAANRHVGLCGQRPREETEFTRVLAEPGVDSISVAPGSPATVKQHGARAESRKGAHDDTREG
ncbi:putative PEP-binding protein [Streptomyces sp. NPDC002809]|uniref:putative PEP-binding protein n=1 Tax=Streptomyces sp. NPDC002809 TaxID=3154433 RepID=UPI003323F303